MKRVFFFYIFVKKAKSYTMIPFITGMKWDNLQNGEYFL